MNTTTLKFCMLALLIGFGFTQVKAQDVTPPAFVSSTPYDREIDVPITKEIRLTYDEPFTVADIALINLNGVPVAPAWVSIDGNTLVIKPASLRKDFNYIVEILPGALQDAEGNLTTDDFELMFHTEKDKPALVSNVDTLIFESQVGIPELLVAILTGTYFAPLNITDIAVALSGDNPEQFSAEEITLTETKEKILTGEPMDVTYTPTQVGEHKALLTVTLTVQGETTPLVVNIVLIGKSAVITGVDEDSYAKVLVKEELYTLTGIRVSAAATNGVYIKKSFYDDGSIDSEKIRVVE